MLKKSVVESLVIDLNYAIDYRYKYFIHIYNAMLKLTNSFYRYFGLSQNLKTQVKKITYLSCVSKRCSKEFVQKDPFIVPFIQTTRQLQLLSSIKKKLYFKNLISSDLIRSKEMSESFRLKFNCGSYGQFSSVEGNTIDNGRLQQNGPSSSTNHNTNSDNKLFHHSKFRTWESMRNTAHCDGNTLRFRLLSYNVLAQCLLEWHPYLYTECSPQNLKWKARASRLYNEIINIAPDIICFQEVQVSHLHTFYADFEKIGYRGVFKQKTGHRRDGCAIYYRHSMFDLIDQVSVEFYQPEMPILNRDNVGIIVKLIPRNASSSAIIVATTHLLYNPKRTDVRLAQMQLFLAEIDRFAYYKNGRECGHYPIIITGDFNSTPDSAVVKLLDRGRVSMGPFRDNSDWRKIGVTDNCQHISVYLDRQKGKITDYSTVKIKHSDNCSNQICEVLTYGAEYDAMFNGSSVGHPLKFASVYEKNKKYLATTFQESWVTVDYIYFSRCSNLKLIEYLRLPTATQCEMIGKLPNDVFGSDHLALAATFSLKQQSSL